MRHRTTLLHRRPAALTAAAVALAAALSLSACTGVPTSSSPELIKPVGVASPEPRRPCRRRPTPIRAPS